MSYAGEYITVTDATQEALDLKANLAGGNTFTGEQIVSTLNCKTDLVLNEANSTVKTRKITAVDGNNTNIDVIGSVNLTNEQGETYVHEYKINNVALKNVTETLTNKTIDANSNTINNIKDAIATNDLSIAQTSGLQAELNAKAPINDSNLTGDTRMTRLTVNHSDTSTIGLNFNNTNNNHYAGSFNTSAYGWRFFNNNTSQLNNTTFGVYTKGTGGQLNPLSVKNDGILYTLNQEVKGNVNLTAGNLYKIDGADIFTPYRTSADTDTLLALKAPINDSNLTGETKMTRLTVNHSDTGSIGLTFNNTNNNQYAGAFNTSAYGWRFFNNNTSQLNNTTFGVYTKGTGSQLNPLLITNDGKIYTLDQEVKGNVNLTAGHEFQIGGVNILDSVPTDAELNAKANDNEVVKLVGDQTISGTKLFDGKLNVEQLSFTRINSIYGNGYINTGVFNVSNILNTTASTLSLTIQSGNTIGQQHLVIYKQCLNEATIDTKNLPQVKISGSNVRSKNSLNIDSVYMRAVGEGILLTWDGTYWFPAVSNTSLEEATMYGTIKHAGTNLDFVKNDAYINFTGANNQIRMNSTGAITFNGVDLKNVLETLTNKTIDANLNTLQNVGSAIAVNELSISQVDQLQIELNTKANSITVTEQLETKANTSYVVNQLSYKADKTYVDANLAKKVDFSTRETISSETQINTFDFNVSEIDAELATTDWDLTITDGTTVGQQHLVYIDKINPSITNTKDVKRINIIGLNVKSFSGIGFNSVLMRLPGESAYLTWTGTHWVSQSSNRSLDQSTLYSSIKMAGNELNFANDNSVLTFSATNQRINMNADGLIKFGGINLKDVTETLINKTIDTADNTLVNIKDAISTNDLSISQTNGLQTVLNEKQIRYLPCLVEHHEASGVNGGTAVAASWNDIVLNTIDNPLRTDYTISNNQITLSVIGTYEISFSVSSYSTIGTKGELIGVTDTGKVVHGTSFTTTNGSGGAGTGIGTITTTQANEVFKLRMFCEGAGLLGKAVGSGNEEVYAQVFIKRLS